MITEKTLFDKRFRTGKYCVESVYYLEEDLKASIKNAEKKLKHWGRGRYSLKIQNDLIREIDKIFKECFGKEFL